MTQQGDRSDPATDVAVDVVGLRKRYDDKVVLDGIDLQVPTGRVFALLGPNGAGKTTTVQILTTLIAADEGVARIAGHDLVRERAAVRGAIGVTGQFSAVDNLLTGRENLQMMADLHHLPRDERRRRPGELLDRFDLADAADRSVTTYSGGMKRRLDLAMSLVRQPQVIFLDEPTTGLDPRSRRVMWDIVRQMVDQGVTVFLTTQYLEEADQLADRIALLDAGRLVAEGTPDELKRSIPGGQVRVRFRYRDQAELFTRSLPEGHLDGLSLTVPVSEDGGIRFQQMRRLLNDLDRVGVEVDDVSIHTPDLDDVFLALTGRPTTPAPTTATDPTDPTDPIDPIDPNHPADRDAVDTTEAMKL